MEVKILAVIVTHNRLQLLPPVVDAIRTQTSPVAKLLVVDNASTDGTKEWLASQPDVAILRQPNVGGAGGFHAGVKAGYEGGFDWVWLMDDDVVPDKDCLQQLLAYSHSSGCINPLHLSADGTMPDEERWFDPTDCTILNLFNQSYQHGKKTWYRNLGSFEGMLVHRNIIEKIGYPDPRFFIAHDDLAYGYLASKYTNVVVVADAVMRRQPVNKSLQSALNYDYYMLRNLWLLEEYARAELPGYDGYRRRRIAWQFLYAIYKVLFVEKTSHKWASLQVIYQAYRDYRRKKGGMR